VADVSKAHPMRAAACNLGIIMLALWGGGTPRSLQGALGLLGVAILWLLWCHYSLRAVSGAVRMPWTRSTAPPTSAALAAA
jgi:hypothetical protein